MNQTFWRAMQRPGMRIHAGPHLPQSGALEYVGALARSQQRFPSGLANTLPRALQQPAAGSCMHLKHICCAKDDWRLMHEVEREIQAASYKKEGDALGFHRSKKHKVAYGEALSEAPAFVSLVKHSLAVFDLTLVDCWANLYSGEDDMKSMHHDNYQDRHPRATATIGISLGQGRHFAFQNPVNHEEHQVVTENGDIFAFDEPFNNLFKHAVPPEAPGTAPGKRIAVIIWANEQDCVPRMVREKNPGMRDIVPLKVDWESWGKCVPGSLSRHDRAGRADLEAEHLADYLQHLGRNPVDIVDPVPATVPEERGGYVERPGKLQSFYHRPRSCVAKAKLSQAPLSMYTQFSRAKATPLPAV